MSTYLFSILLVLSLFFPSFGEINWKEVVCPPDWADGAPDGCECDKYSREDGPGDAAIDACAICCKSADGTKDSDSGYIYNIIGDDISCHCDSNCEAVVKKSRRRRLSDTSNPFRCDACSGGSYIVVDDGIEMTFQEAEEYCRIQYSSDLASINTVEESECPCDIINTAESDTGPAWIGLWHPRSEAIVLNDPHYFVNIDGSSCREYHNLHTNTCGNEEIWKDDEPDPCFVGSKCVNIDPSSCKISNDIPCEMKLKRAVCNAEGSATGEMPSFEELN